MCSNGVVIDLPVVDFGEGFVDLLKGVLLVMRDVRRIWRVTLCEQGRGGQTFPKSTEIRNSVVFRAVFSVFFRPNFSVWQNRFPSSFCSSHDVLTYWEANSG